MNNILKNSLRGCSLLAVGLLAYACSDDWNEHYDTAAVHDYDGTMLEYLASQADLSQFYDIVCQTGFDDQLNSSQVLTVFAPVNGVFNYDSLVSEIEAGSTENVLERFVKNHVTLYNINIGSDEQQVTLLNEKLVDVGTLSTLVIDDVAVSTANLSCSNGVVQVLEGYLEYKANLFERLEILNDSYLASIGGGDDSTVTLFNFLLKYDEEELDEDQSVAIGLNEDGNTEYIDSVTIHNNEVLEALDAYLYREDSTYMVIYPTAEAYQARVEENAKYFNFGYAYSSDEAYRDSMQNYYANYFALNDLLFNMNDNQHAEDSLFSTSYNRYNWEYNVFYKPYEAGGILDPSTIEQEIECSNGTLYVVNDYPYTIYDAFFQEIKCEGESMRYIDTSTDQSWYNTYTGYTSYSNSADSISDGRYLYVYATSSSRQTSLGFSIPNTLSGSYDIYIRTLPQSVRVTDSATIASSLPAQYRFSLYERGSDTGTYPSSATTTFRNPEDGSRNYVTDAFNIDTLYIGTYEFANSYYGASDAGVVLQMESYVTTSARNTYTKELYLDCIILKPSEATEDSEEEESAE